MQLARLNVSLENLGEIARVVSEQNVPVVLAASDADVVMLVSSLRDQLRGPIGVWLEISADYSAPLAARDVATLSWLVDLDYAVISAISSASSHADVVTALLTDDEVNFANDVATLRGAYNRPAPPRPVAVWSFDGTTMLRDDEALIEHTRVTTDAGELTCFARDVVFD